MAARAIEPLTAPPIKERVGMIEWQWSAFDELGIHELYELMVKRQEVFVVEQKCPYQDADGVDPLCHHLLGWKHEADGKRELVTSLRFVPPGIKYDEMSIGRVISTAKARGTGAGKLLVAEALKRADSLYPGQTMRISAQQYLVPFYSGFGFIAVSEAYDEDGIPHVEMLRPGRAMS